MTVNLSIHQSINSRPHQEDRYIAMSILDGHLLAVIDGHSGTDAADIVAANLPKLFTDLYLKEWAKAGPRLQIGARKERQIVRRVIEQLFEITKNEEPGTTLSFAYLYYMNHESRYRLITATVGDSPLTFWNGRRYIHSKPHSAKYHTKDIEHINSLEEGFVQQNRVFRVNSSFFAPSCIAVTRALGDKSFGDVWCEETTNKNNIYNKIALFITKVTI